MLGKYVVVATLSALGSLMCPQACLAGPATEALENYHGDKFPGQVTATSGLFDMSQVAPKIVGTDEWAKITSHEQQEYIDLMQRFLMANYAKHAKKYSKFEFVEEELLGTEAAVVARANDEFGTEMRLVYKLSSKSGSWRLVDLVTDDISTVSVHRSQQQKIIRVSGFPILLQKIRDRLSKPSI